MSGGRHAASQVPGAILEAARGFHFLADDRTWFQHTVPWRHFVASFPLLAREPLVTQLPMCSVWHNSASPGSGTFRTRTITSLVRSEREDTMSWRQQTFRNTSTLVHHVLVSLLSTIRTFLPPATDHYLSFLFKIIALRSLG